jgi:hypothetical protein
MVRNLPRTVRRIVSAFPPFVSYQGLAVAGVAVVLAAGLIAAATAQADQNDGPTVGSEFSSSFSPARRPAPPELVHGMPRASYAQPAHRTMSQHRPYYRDRYYGDPHQRDDNRRGHHRCRHHRYHY